MRRPGVRIPSPPPCDLSGDTGQPGPQLGSGFSVSGVGAWGSAGGLVVAGGVDGQLADELAGGGVDDADVEVVDELDDAGSAVGPADADVVQAAVDAQGELAVPVDDVMQHAVVDVAGAVGAGAGFRAGLVGGRRGRSVG